MATLCPQAGAHLLLGFLQPSVAWTGLSSVACRATLQQVRCFSVSSTTAASAAAATTPAPSSAAVITRSQKRKANLEYCRRRAAWQRQLTDLRRQWASELQQKQQQAREERLKARAQIQAALQLDTSSQEHAEEHRQKRERERMLQELRQAEYAVEVANRKLLAAVRDKVRKNILNSYQKQRLQVLQTKSTSWIPEKDFEARVKEALDNPLHMM